MNSTLAALTILNGLLINASQISALVQQAQSEGRSVLTEAEWETILAADNNARKLLADAIAKAAE